MSLQKIEAALLDFVSSTDCRVVALSGRWGTGKTYYWKRFVERQSRNARSAQYSYVSLFGVPDLSSLKDAVFEASLTLPLPPPASQGRSQQTDGAQELSLAARVGQLAKRVQQGGRKYFGLLEKLPKLKDIAPLVRSVAFLTVADYLVCLDDLERHSDTLQIKDILGFVTMLRDERKSRVLVILNTDALLEKDAAEFQRFREKVFDYEITFDPSPEDCIGIVFPNGKAQYALAAEFSRQLGIQNIRILSRAKRVIDLLAPFVSGLDPMVLRQVVHSTVLLTWSYNSHGETAPPFDYLKRLNFGAFVKLPGVKEARAEQTQWNDLLSRYDYTNTDDLDLGICNMLEGGFLDEAQIRRAVNDRHDAAVRSALEKRYKDAWDIFHSGFGQDEERLVAVFEESFKGAVKWINLPNAAATTTILRELGYEDLANNLMQYWIHVQSETNPTALNLDDNMFVADVKDKAFLEAIAEASSQLGKDPTLEEVVRSLAARNGWNPVDERVLIAASEEDFYILFKSLSGSETRPCVRACLRFGEFANPSNEYAGIAAKARAALQRIGAESPLNRRRVQSYGIDVPNQTTSGG